MSGPTMSAANFAAAVPSNVKESPELFHLPAYFKFEGRLAKSDPYQPAGLPPSGSGGASASIAHGASPLPG